MAGDSKIIVWNAGLRVLRKSEEKGNSASVEAWIDRLYD